LIVTLSPALKVSGKPPPDAPLAPACPKVVPLVLTRIVVLAGAAEAALVIGAGAAEAVLKDGCVVLPPAYAPLTEDTGVAYPAIVLGAVVTTGRCWTAAALEAKDEGERMGGASWGMLLLLVSASAAEQTNGTITSRKSTPAQR